MRSTGTSYGPNKMSGVFRIGRTTVLEVGRVKGSRFTAVASQLHTWSRNEDQQGALTWSGGMGCNLANPPDMDI